jgi:hypothetical protein
MHDARTDPSEAIAAIGHIGAVSSLLHVLCELTTMGFAAVARVTENAWTACAVHDTIGFGMKVGQQLDVRTTLCREVRTSQSSVLIDHASADARYCEHATPKLYGFESYISVPIILASGEYFGNLCALDPRPLLIAEPRIELMFNCFARLIAEQLQMQAAQQLAQVFLLDAGVVSNLRRLFVAMLMQEAGRGVGGAQGHCYRPVAVAEDGAWPRVPLPPDGMSDLIDDILTYARGRVSGGIPIHLRPVGDLAAGLSGVVLKKRSEHGDRTVIDNIEMLPSVYCDRERILALADHLLANALVLGGPAGPVSFVASADGADLRIEVWHDGSPISPLDMATLFSPFRGPENDRRFDRLRLHLCAEIVQAHGGSLKASSSDHGGSQFVATVPLTATRR